MREGVEQEEMKEEDVGEDEERLLEQEQLVVKEGRKNLDGGRGGWEWSRRWQQCPASEGWRLLYSSQHSSSLLGPVHKYVE